MVHTLKASAPFVFLDRRCILGQGVRIAPAGQMAMRLNSYTPRRSGISCRAYAVASNGTVCTSWFPTDPTQCDAYGGWSHGGITLEKEKRKGFRARLYAPAAGLHQLLMPVTSRVLPPFKMADHVHATAEDIDPILPDVGKTVPSNLRDENQKEKDYDSEKIEVSCVPGTEIRPGRTIIPAAFDPAQVEALSVLEKLKFPGYSRRFQPDKPVTKGQAAVAIISGQVEDMVREELSRLEAENSAKEEVVQEILSEMFSRGEIKSMWEKKVSQKKAQRVEAEKLLESVVYELENEKAEREKMLPLFLKEKTMLEVEHKLLVSLKLEVDELKQALSVGEMEVLLEQQQLEKHRMDYQVRNEALSKAKSLAEAEKKALTLSRLWVEDEARRTQAQGEILAEAVKRWKFSEASLACSCWCHHQEKTKEIASSEEHKSGHVSFGI